MDRRQVLRNISLITGAAFVGGELFLQTGCKPANNAITGVTSLSPKDFDLLNEIGEAIIPTTNTPGAKAANVAQFMSDLVNDCYSEKDRKIFIEGLADIQSSFQSKYKKSFAEATREEKSAFLMEKDSEAKEVNKANQEKAKEERTTHYFTMLKQLTILGYFNSEIGATQTLRYVAVPGRYEGDVPYKKGDRAWAT